MARTEQEILSQTNDLAKKLYALRGYHAPSGYKFWLAKHPHEVEAWQGACEAQLMLTGTDPEDALENIESGNI